MIEQHINEHQCPDTIKAAEVQKIMSEVKLEIHPSNIQTIFLCVLAISLYFLPFLFAKMNWFPVYFLSLPISLTMLSIIIHESAHYSLFSSKYSNTVLGYIAGVLCWIPFFSYRRGHNSHHVWVGSNQDKDPTPSPKEKMQPDFLLNILFKIRLPILYWSGVYVKYALYDLFPSASKRRLSNLITYICNIVIICVTHLFLICWVGLEQYLWIAISGFIGWGMVYEHIFTMTQHLGLSSVPEDQSRYNYREQMNFSRSVYLPFSWIFFHFNLHKEHHLIPGLNYQYLPCLHNKILKLRPDIYGYTSNKITIRRQQPIHEALSPSVGDKNV